MAGDQSPGLWKWLSKFKNGQFNIKFDVISITVMWTFSISTNWLCCVSEFWGNSRKSD